MNKQIERILICILWLLATTLGTSFIMNTLYGFNMFSGRHWQYLSYLQAAQTPVRTSFYITLILCIMTTLGVLYILIRPKGLWKRTLKINQHREQTQQHTTPQPAQQNNIPTTPATQNTPAPTATVPPRPARPTPPRITIRPSVNNNAPATPTQTVTPDPAATPQPTPQTFTSQVQPQPAPAAPTFNMPTPNSPANELREIFTNAGYTVKNVKKIGKFAPALFAIGTGETLWIGGIGTTTAPLLDAMERLLGIFTETLEDIDIHINGFIVAPLEEYTGNDIMIFKDLNNLREYIDKNKNVPPTDNNEQENFDAYSGYIDTVITYMDKT